MAQNSSGSKKNSTAKKSGSSKSSAGLKKNGSSKSPAGLKKNGSSKSPAGLKKNGSSKSSPRLSSPTRAFLILLGILILAILLSRIVTVRRNASGDEEISPIAAEEAETSAEASAEAPAEISPEVYDTEEEPALPTTELQDEDFDTEDGYTTYQSETTISRAGIDVSSHQGWIDWGQVADSGVEFAIIRAGYRGYTDGSIHQDEYFTYNIESASANGLDVGVYFFSQALTPEEAEEEAQKVLEIVSGYDLQYPIYFDWEAITGAAARTDTITAGELTACAQAFCSTIEEAGYRAGIYFNLSQSIRLYHLTELTDYAFWLAEYHETPSFPYAVDQWQYSSEGSVPGISTAVDLDLSFEAG